MSFYIDGYICKIQRDNGETHQGYIERGYFIACQKPKTTKEFEKSVTYSKIYSNAKNLGCTYNDEVMIELKKMEKNLWVDG